MTLIISKLWNVGVLHLRKINSITNCKNHLQPPKFILKVSDMILMLNWMLIQQSWLIHITQFQNLLPPSTEFVQVIPLSKNTQHCSIVWNIWDSYQEQLNSLTSFCNQIHFNLEANYNSISSWFCSSKV